MSAPSTLARARISWHGHHHAHVHDLEVVALEHDGDDVLADVVHVALDRGDDDLALGAHVAAGGLVRASSLLDVGHAGAPRPASSRAPTSPPAAGTSCPAPNRSPTMFMPSISGPSITCSGRPPLARICLVGLLGVLDDEVGDAVHQRVATGAATSPALGVPRHSCFLLSSLAPLLAVSATSTRRSPASGRRFSTTSSTRSRSSGSRSS